MPLIKNSSFSSNHLLQNGHVQTIYPYLFRYIHNLPYKRERVITPDGDFLDLDWLENDSSSLVILSHGLEGCSQSPYIKGMAKKFRQEGFDILAWNMRSCSGEINWLERYYHAGDTPDLEFVIRHALKKKNYHNLYLVGFSLGANLTAKYLGDPPKKHPSALQAAVLISNPVDLRASDERIHMKANRVYMDIFLKTMKKKIRQKASIMSLSQVDINHLEKVESLKDFNDFFVAPLHGFKSINSYYQEASCKNVLHKIHTPTLLISAKNDPFLARECFPMREAKRNAYLYLEITNSGGHMGFVNPKDKSYWSESRALEFIYQHTREEALKSSVNF